MCSDGYDESVFKLKKEYRDMRDKMDHKMNNITDVNKIVIEINDELKKNIEWIHEILFNLSDDLRLRQAEINMINAKIGDALNFVWNEIYRKNRKNEMSSKGINRDKLELLERMHSSTNDIISDIKNKLLMIYLDMYLLHEKDIDKVHLINSEIKKS